MTLLISSAPISSLAGTSRLFLKHRTEGILLALDGMKLGPNLMVNWAIQARMLLHVLQPKISYLTPHPYTKKGTLLLARNSKLLPSKGSQANIFYNILLIEKKNK